MSSQTVLNLVIGVAVLGLLIYRQLQARPVRGNQRLVLVLAMIGVILAVKYIQRLDSLSAAIGALAGSLVLAAVFGAVRAATVRIWMQDGQPWVQGNLLTAALWILALGAHLGYDYLVGQHKDISGIGNATLVLYLAVTLGVQRLIVVFRAQRLDPSAFRRVGRGAT
jgi:drug/metabolite transporter (DMT)-like permease